MASILLDIWENIYVGLIGAGLTALLIKAAYFFREYRLRKKYPIAGSYVSLFEDEIDGKPFVARSKVEIIQKGLDFTGQNYIDGGKVWNLSGRISKLGYVSGIYYADSPYDPGNGTFFLKIEGVDLDGLWSGYDSVNRSLQGGRYWFRRTPRMELVDVNDRYRAAALSIADQTLGAGYLNDLADGDGLHNASSIISIVDGSVLGFATFSIEPQGFLESSEKYGRIKFPLDLRSADRAGMLGHIRIVGVSPSAQGRGIGSALIEEAERRLRVLGARAIIVFGWTTEQGTHIGGILERMGYRNFVTVDEFWKDESIAQAYDCAHCGNPCICSVKVYKKALA